MSFPFPSPDLVPVHDDELPLSTRTIHPDLPGLFSIGLLQPLGAIMPLAEAKSQWVAGILTGGDAPPTDAEVRRQMAPERSRA